MKLLDSYANRLRDHNKDASYEELLNYVGIFSLNTYKYAGLPVGPICNPGIASINASLTPESHNYLYYVVEDEKTRKT